MRKVIKYFLFLHLETDEGIVGIGEKVTGSSFNNSNITGKPTDISKRLRASDDYGSSEDE